VITGLQLANLVLSYCFLLLPPSQSSMQGKYNLTASVKS
jgi:hypothetical protein